METITLSDFQQRVLEFPEEVNLALLGGKGGGKSTSMAMLALRYVMQYKDLARALFVRQSYSGLRDFEDCTRDIYQVAYSGAARYSGNSHTWRFPNGAYFELAQIEAASDLAKFAGRSFGLIFVDELGQYASPELINQLTANLRAKKGVPMRKVFAANPGSVGQGWLFRKFIAGRVPWQPYRDENGELWVYCPSTMRDNPHLDQEKYRQALESALRDDPESLKALLEGSFTSATGAYFGLCLDERRNAVGPFTPGDLPKTYGREWPTFLAHDFGSSAPSVTYLMTESPGAEYAGKFYPRGSLIALDEYAVYRRDNLAAGLGWTAATTAEALREWCATWKVSPSGVGDDAMFAKTGHVRSIAEEFAAKGVRFYPARKGDRVSGWQRMRRLLADAGKPDLPGLYVSRSCSYWWNTVPYLSRDQKRVEDVDSSGQDHGADAMRYGLNRQQPAQAINLGRAH